MHEPRVNESVRRETPKKKHPMRFILIGLFLLLLSGAAYAGWRIFQGAGHTAEPGYYTVAVFGVDSRNGSVGKEVLSDVNVLARFDMASGEIRLVSLYRDTYSQISEDGTFHKLNEAYFRGGPEQAVWAVEHNTDVKVDDYATFNWKAIADAINILGGIDLEISDSEFRYINAYITETVNSTGVGSYQLEHAGMNHLDGVQAVAYARLRLMDTDFNRTERQRKVVKLA
ncbi:MAG: LCP family protein, partial [Lachnospiraceae bacterium]|nr:LCP family protein [Lachnospiraceae bacterium]